MIPETLEKRNSILFEKLVPQEGKADTIEGESLRAINRILYRFYNDGDYWFEGYGTETAGPAETFLREYCPINVTQDLKKSDNATKENYEKQLLIVLNKIINHIENTKEFQENSVDMLECEPKYEEVYDDEE